MTLGYLFSRNIEASDRVREFLQVPLLQFEEFMQTGLTSILNSQGPCEYVDKNLMLRLVKLGDGHILLQRLQKSRGWKGYSVDSSTFWWTVIALEAKRKT